MLWYWLSAADLVRCRCLVSCRHGDTIPIDPIRDDQEAASLHELLGQDGAGLGLDPAVEVAGDVLRHGAVLATQPLETGLGALQRVSKLECSVGGGLAWRLKTKLNIRFNVYHLSYRQWFKLLLSLLVLHADGAAHEDDEEYDESSGRSSDDDRDNIITWQTNR